MLRQFSLKYEVVMTKINIWQRLRRDRTIFAYYRRFESVVAFLLTIVISLIILVALFRLGSSVVDSLLLGALNPLEHKIFQTVFGEIMTLLIALEFNHTLQYVVASKQSIIQTKVILLIALLALARKLIVLDLHEVDAGQMLGLAAITLALGITYWLMRERDDRLMVSKSSHGD